MLLRSLARALAEAARRPGVALAISLTFSAVFLAPAWAAALLGSKALLGLAFAWAWWGAAWLALACKAARDSGDGWLRSSLRQALGRTLERVASALAAGLIGAWALLALRYYRGGQGALALAGLAASTLLGLWLALAAMLSVPLAADDASWRVRWRAAALMPLAFFPACLGAALLLALLSGLGAVAVGMERRVAALLWWPAALMPVLTPAFAGWFLLGLVDAMRARGQGRPEAAGPTWRELFQPWR